MMHVITANNVNDALIRGVDLFRSPRNYRDITVRGKRTLEAIGPVVTQYLRPRERVLFNDTRDANPFFHFFECLWMMDGRNDVAWIARFNKNIANYSDDGKTFNGAYGHRMRRRWGDQLATAIHLLRKDPNTRRAVIQLWDAATDLSDDSVSVDIPCNDMLKFSIRDEKLHMTVFNRSNDMVWGAYGANAVHFSFFQEYAAAVLGLEVGVYTQFSDSFHVYPDDYPKWDALLNDVSVDMIHYDYYGTHVAHPFPIVSNTEEEWDRDLQHFMRATEVVDELETTPLPRFNDPFFSTVAWPMFATWRAYKEHGKRFAEDFTRHIRASDWRIAVEEWLERRKQ